jgi:hypothetical protein
MFSICSDQMTDQATIGTAEAPAWARPMLERQLQMLGELAEIGLELARAVEAEAKGPDANLDRAMLAYSRVARAVRQTIMLQSRLIQGPPGEDEAAERPAALRAEVKARIGRIVRRVIEGGPETPEGMERLKAEAAERLEAEAFGDVLERPVVEIIAEICKHLGLKPDWAGLVDEINAAETLAAYGSEDGTPDKDDTVRLWWLYPDGPRPARGRRDGS